MQIIVRRLLHNMLVIERRHPRRLTRRLTARLPYQQLVTTPYSRVNLSLLLSPKQRHTRSYLPMLDPNVVEILRRILIIT